MSNWNYQEKEIKSATWLRSWRQEFFTDFNSDFAFVAHMEEVTADEQGNKLSSQDKGFVRRTASQVMSDPDVLALNELMTKLVKKWWDEDHAVVETDENPTE